MRLVEVMRLDFDSRTFKVTRFNDDDSLGPVVSSGPVSRSMMAGVAESLEDGGMRLVTPRRLVPEDVVTELTGETWTTVIVSSGWL